MIPDRIKRTLARLSSQDLVDIILIVVCVPLLIIAIAAGPVT